MELGNYFFGHSRGEYPVPRTSEYEQPIFDLIEKITGEYTCYVPEYENEMFVMHPYWWAACNCIAGYDDATDHAPTCGLVRPNFLYKPTGYELRVYKYPMRDSFANQDLTPQQFREMMDACIASVKETVVEK